MIDLIEKKRTEVAGRPQRSYSQHLDNRKIDAMTNSMKLVFTGISATLAAIGLLAIMTKTHTSSVRFQGIVTVIGDDAVWVGQIGLLLAVLPLLVWLPARWFGVGVALWWVGLTAWLFVPFFMR